MDAARKISWGGDERERHYRSCLSQGGTGQTSQEEIESVRTGKKPVAASRAGLLLFDLCPPNTRRSWK